MAANGTTGLAGQRNRPTVSRVSTGGGQFNQKFLTAFNLPGLRYVMDGSKHPLERFFWAATIVAAIRVALYLGQLQYGRYTASPTVVQMDKNYRDWVGIMPAITFCFHNRVDWGRAARYLGRFHVLPNGSMTSSEWSLEGNRYLAEFMRTLVNLTANELSKVAPYIDDTNLAAIDILEMLSAVHPDHDIAINSFNPVHNEQLSVTQIITERGVCYTLNAPLGLLQSTDRQRLPSKGEIRARTHVSCEFSKHLCYMKIDTYRSTVSFAIHSPYDVATNDLPFLRMEETDELVAIYTLLETVANERLKDLTVKQRNCFFYDESYEKLPFYSYNLCIMSCRARRALNLCRCRPHFYPFVEGPSCTLQGLHCLGSNPVWYSEVGCNCLKSCTDVRYFIGTTSKTQWTASGGIPFTQKASLRWEILQPKTRLRRELLFSFEDLLVSFGGAIALFIGKNVYSMSKIVSFLVIETAKFIHQKVQRFRQKSTERARQ